MTPPDPGGVLARIAGSVRARLKVLKKQWPVRRLRAQPLYARLPKDFSAAFPPGRRVIAEVKFASPSAGALRPGASAEEAVRIAGGYLSAGAAALSILTEPRFFSGSPDYLAAVRRRFPRARLLMKDFFLDPYQFEIARAHGADAILLIAALLRKDLAFMLGEARRLGLTPLVEVHTLAELRAAEAVGAELIGVNSRNLRTLETDLAVAERLAAESRSGAILIAESGLRTGRDLKRLGDLGYRGFLIGTELMRRPDPGRALRALLGR